MIHPTDKAQRLALKHKKQSKKAKVDAYKKRRKEELEIEDSEDEIRAAKAGIEGNDPGRSDGDNARVGSDTPQSVDLN